MNKNKNLKNEKNDSKKDDDDHIGKINEVPWSAVQAYLTKYKGVGRFKSLYLESTKMNKEKEGEGRQRRAILRKPGTYEATETNQNKGFV